MYSSRGALVTKSDHAGISSRRRTEQNNWVTVAQLAHGRHGGESVEFVDGPEGRTVLNRKSLPRAD